MAFSSSSLSTMVTKGNEIEAGRAIVEDRGPDEEASPAAGPGVDRVRARRFCGRTSLAAGKGGAGGAGRARAVAEGSRPGRRADYDPEGERSRRLRIRGAQRDA